jgi:predicted Zn-dependent peptidase
MSRAARSLAPNITIERFALSNGLRVAVAPDRSSPSVFVAAYYDVGFRSEPEGRTGFAHLFEHLMFQGSATLEKGLHDELVNGNGGVLNGSTRNDFTNYFELMPSSATELALFLESDRMRGLRLTPENLQNQIDVVKEEIKVNVVNQPYGGFPWLYLPMVLFDTFPNAHDAYGDFGDLDAATLEDAAAFFDRYYAPGNAVLTVAGDVDPDQVHAWVDKHFGDIPARPVPPTVEASEPPPARERRKTRKDARAPQPALATGYRTPDPITEFDDYAATVLACEVLTSGEASRLYQRLIKEERIASHVGGEVGLVAGTFEVRGPSMFQVQVFYPDGPKPDDVLRALDDEVARLANEGPEDAELDRFRNSYLAGYLGSIDGLMNRGMLVSAFEQQRARPELINEIPAALANVKPADVARVTGEWFSPKRRAVLDWQPGARA